MAKEKDNKKSEVGKEVKEWEAKQKKDDPETAKDPEGTVEKTMDALSTKGKETKASTPPPKKIKMGGHLYKLVQPEAPPKQIKVGGVLYKRLDDSDEVRIAGKVYKKAQMNAEQAMQAAADIAMDIRALAPFLKRLGLEKDYANAMGVAKAFDGMADRMLKAAK